MASHSTPAQLGPGVVKMTFDRSRFMNNLNKARFCWKCDYLHVGRHVNHNHCDCPCRDRFMATHTVHGKFTIIDGEAIDKFCMHHTEGWRHGYDERDSGLSA